MGLPMRNALFALPVALMLGGAVFAQNLPQPSPMPPEIAAPRDVAYRGAIKLSVDATDTVRHIIKVRETIPVTPGSVTLLFPRWIPGAHAPVGRIDQLAGLVIRANGTRLPWRRDTVDGYAYHVEAPPGTNQLDIEFQSLTPVDREEGRIVMTPDMMNLQWQNFVLYPAGYFASRINVEAGVTVPSGFQIAGALDKKSEENGTAEFQPVSLETLIDSPLYAGRYFKTFDLTPEGSVPVRLNVMADRPELLEAKPEHIEAHKNLVRQAYRLFGGYHYDRYDFLLSLSNQMGGIGLEHHRSSENGTTPTFFTEWDRNADTRDLIPHEFTHSWNGKFRRPADLWTANYSMPMRDSLLWVYEGQTQYWGYVLAARSGLLSKQQALDAIAATAAVYDVRKGREWRPLQDTTNDPVLANRRPIPWRSWQRSEDYYSEGELIWLDADTLIREMTDGKKSLDDFAASFFGIRNGNYVPATYTFEDVVKNLNAAAPHDWTKFLRTRLDSYGTGAPLDGLTRGGYKLVFTDTPTDFGKASETRRRVVDLTYSLGFVIGEGARLTDVLWEGPAFAAGLTVGTQIVAVNGFTYDADRLREIVKQSKGSKSAIELIVKNGDRYRTLAMDYHGGLRYPHLERVESVPARLDAILAAK
jgi:predicted metalloprotease with PDZ domain